MATPTGPFQAQIVNNMCLPGEKPKSMRVVLDFSSTDEYVIDLLDEVQAGRIKSVQTLYIDNSDNASAIQVLAETTQQRLIIPPRVQGYFPILLPDPPKFSVRGAVATVVVHMINVPMPAYSWATQ